MHDHEIWSQAKRVRVWNGVDPAIFENEIKPLGQPALLKGLVSDWPMVRAGSPAALSALIIAAASDKPISYFEGAPELAGRYNYKPDFSGFNFERRTGPFAAFLDRLIDEITAPSPPSLYAGAVNVPAHAPALEQSHAMPLLAGVDERLVSLWIGNRGRAPAHWDLAQNIACVIAGRRRFTVFPTEQVANLYIGPLDVTIAGQPSSLVDFHAPDFDAFPRFRDAIAAAEIADLEPGDALYLPSLWIHHVEARDPFGVMMNFWWRDGPPHLITPFFTMLHALLTLRGMPANERQAWRAMFDHFIFEQNGDPFAHLPEHARGIFGEMTPERLQMVRERLLRTLLPRG
ncbi:MAG: cupin-like domain-containing protein [Hyphomonadaceae bacterium]|nr:cupin-like domain-containing protein [Hyphomonadaceae bacterium]